MDYAIAFEGRTSVSHRARSLKHALLDRCGIVTG